MIGLRFSKDHFGCCGVEYSVERQPKKPGEDFPGGPVVGNPPANVPKPGIELGSPALQVDSLPDRKSVV